MTATPAPLASIPPSRLAALRWVLTDIDDTLTTEGVLTAEAYAAIAALTAAGIQVVPVTGRPAGWCDLIARQWPVAAVVGENGALWYAYDAPARRMRRWYAEHDATRRAKTAALHALAEDAMRAVPGTAIAADQPFRLFDVAVDFCEDVPPLPIEAANKVADIFRAGGASAKVSSIHVNAWMGDWDKRAGLGALFAALWQPLESVLAEVAYLGDSPNDSPLFQAIPLSVGVANVLPFLPTMPSPPAFITRAPAGEGFCEFAAALLQARATIGRTTP